MYIVTYYDLQHSRPCLGCYCDSLAVRWIYDDKMTDVHTAEASVNDDPASCL